MMYRLFTIIVLMGVLGSSAGATDTVSTDGAWWNSLTESQQTAVMFGSTSAYLDGYVDGAVAEEVTINYAVSKAPYLTSSQRDTLSSRISNEFSEIEYPDFSGKAIRVYIAGMTNFYTEHPTAFNMDFSDVFECIQNKPKSTCDDVAGRYARSHKSAQ